MDNPKTRQTEVLAGYMLKGSYGHKFYHSPVYAVRVPKEKPVSAISCAVRLFPRM